MHVLVAEDDTNIRMGLASLLKAEGYQVSLAENGQAALELFNTQQPDFVLLDIMMPGLSGYDVCRGIRQQNQSVPVVFISAKSEEIDRVVGLELGADDYIMKPFGAREVAARIRAIARRCLAQQAPTESSGRFTMGDLEILPQQLRASRQNQSIDLSPRDVNILRLLHRKTGEAVSRETLFNECWGRDYLPSSRTLDQHISKLRKLIKTEEAQPEIIHTVHGVGYRFNG